MGRHAVQTMLTRVLVTLLLIVQSSLWTRLLAPEGRGLLAKLQTGQSLLILFLGFGMNAAISYFGSKSREELGRWFGFSLIFTLAGSALAAAGLALIHFVQPLDFIFPDGYATPFFIAYFFLSFVMSQFQLSTGAVLAADHRFAKLNRIEITSTLLRLTLILGAFLFFRGRSSIEVLLALDVVAHAMKTIFFFFELPRISVRPARFRLRDTRPLFTYALPIYFLTLIQFLYQRIDVWFIESARGLSALGIFASALGLAQYMTMIPIALNTVLIPNIGRELDEKRRYSSLVRFSRLNATLALFPALILIAMPGEILRLMCGDAFLEGATSLRFLAIGYWFASVKHVFIHYNASQGRLASNFAIETVGLIVGLALNWLWIPRYGITGAASAYIVMAASTTLFSYLSVRSAHRDLSFQLFFMTKDDVHDWWKSLKKINPADLPEDSASARAG